MLRLSVFLILLGRAYQFYFFGAPFRAVLWDESLMAPIIEFLFGLSWDNYATNTTYSDYIDNFSKLCGIILLLGSIMSLFWCHLNLRRVKNTIISLCILILFVLGICIFKDNHFSILQFFELFIQISLPIGLLLYYNKSKSKITDVRLITMLKVAVSVTFIAHGLYAIGIPFYPGHFIDMTIKITGLTEDQSKVFLTIAGALDIIAAVSIYFKSISKYALLYVFIWGLLTASARIVAGFNLDYAMYSIHNSLYTTIYRLPHGLIAAILFSMTYSKLNYKKTNYSKSVYNEA